MRASILCLFFDPILCLDSMQIAGMIVMMDSLQSYKTNQTPGSAAEPITAGSWRLSIPPTRAGQYRWVQLDDYSGLSRGRFNWQAPLRFQCSARVSHPKHPGTWGFGFWNDPFTANLLIKGTGMRLPTLPNVAWFMHASPESQLTLQNSKQANGLLAAVFQAPLIPSPAFIPGYLFLPLVFIPPVVRVLAKAASRIVRDEFKIVDVDQTTWNSYRIDIHKDRVEFFLNGERLFQTAGAPRGRLGALVWIDNQHAGIDVNGRITAGALEFSKPAWLEIKNWEITPLR
jgi:hypothetical protein